MILKGVPWPLRVSRREKIRRPDAVKPTLLNNPSGSDQDSRVRPESTSQSSAWSPERKTRRSPSALKTRPWSYDVMTRDGSRNASAAAVQIPERDAHVLRQRDEQSAVRAD